MKRLIEVKGKIKRFYFVFKNPPFKVDSDKKDCVPEDLHQNQIQDPEYQ